MYLYLYFIILLSFALKKTDFMTIKNLPKTVALIPDGNRRWAKANVLSVAKGYDLGVKKFIEFSEWCKSYGIDSIAVWAFSTENFSRDKTEVKELFKIYKRAANDKEILARLQKNQTRLKVVGNTKLLPPDLLAALKKVENKTKHYKGRVINMLIGYGGKDDILNAVKKMVGTVKNPSVITDALFRKYLISGAMPEIDLIIRTSGEHRLSGFMPWQTSYSELYFSKKLWPDFTKQDLHTALLDYNKRHRRFGK